MNKINSVDTELLGVFPLDYPNCWRYLQSLEIWMPAIFRLGNREQDNGRYPLSMTKPSPPTASVNEDKATDNALVSRRLP